MTIGQRKGHICSKIKKGFYVYRGYEIKNYGYYPPNKCIWWEAVDIKTGCGDFHAHTLKQIIKDIDNDLVKATLKEKTFCANGVI